MSSWRLSSSPVQDGWRIDVTCQGRLVGMLNDEGGYVGSSVELPERVLASLVWFACLLKAIAAS